MLYMLMNGALSGYMAPDDGDGSGGGGGGSGTPPNPPEPPTPPEPPVKSYSQQEKDADEAKLRRRYDREIKELKKTHDEQAAAIEAFKKQQDQNPLPPSIQPPGGQSPSGDQGRLELLEARHARSEKELNERIKAAEESAENEKQTRLRLQRDQLLDDAIRAVGVTPKHSTQARRYFLTQVEWDDLEGESGGWVFRTKKGNLIPIMDGVAEELPDNLKPSKMKHGGAGNTNGLPQSQQRKARVLEEAKKKLSELKVDFRRGGGKNAAMMAFTKQKRVVEALELEFSAPK